MPDPKKPPPKKPEPVAVTTKSGKTGYLPGEFAQDAQEAGGLRRATDDELRAAQRAANKDAADDALRAKFEGSLFSEAEGATAPFVAGAARGLSLNASDDAILRAAQILGGNEGREAVRQRLNDYQAYSPIGSTAGEFAGILGGALVGDEAVLGAVPSAIGRLGVGAEGAVARALGEGALARGAGVLARGAVEGGVYGAAGAYGEATLGDKDLTGEALVGGAAHGALGGMIASGAFGLAGRALSGLRGPSPTAAAYESLASKEFGEAAPKVGRAIADEAGGLGPYRTAGLRSPEGGIADSIAGGYISARPGAALGERELQAEAWANRAKVFGKHAETLEDATRNFSQALDEALVAGRKADMASFGEAKVNQMSRLVDQARFVDQSNAAIAWATDANAIVSKISGDATAGMGPSAVRKWNGHMQKIAEAIESGKSVNLHTALDNTKRFMGQEAAFGKGPFGLSVAQKEFDALYQGESGLKTVLESTVWGDAASKAQLNINAATHQMLSEGKLFTRKFTTEFGSEAGRPLYAADTSAVSGFMGRLTSAGNDLDARGVESWINARKSFLDAIGKSYTFDAVQTKAIAQERAALAKLETTYKTATKDVTLANQVRAALSEERERGFGGAVGAMFDLAAKPLTTLHRLAQIEAHTKGVLGKLSGESKRLVGAAGDAAEKNAAKIPAPKSKEKGFFSTFLDGLDKGARGAAGATSRDVYARRADEIGRMQANPALVTSRVTESLSPLSQAAPNVTAAATMTAMRGLEFLASKLPPSRLDPFSLQPQLQPRNRASDAEISQFMRYTQAVDDPLIVLRDAQKGTLTRDHVEAVKAVYPKLYDEIRVNVMQSLVDSKKELSFQRKIQLGILLDIPTDKTLSPDFLRAIQATFPPQSAEAESPPPKAAAPNIAGSVQTATQQAVERAG